MRAPARVLLLCLLSGADVLCGQPMLPPLPAADGELSGVLRWADAPPVAWSVSAASDGGTRTVKTRAEGDGLTYSGSIAYDPATLDGTWRQEASARELALWLPAIRRLDKTDTLAGLTLAGMLSVSSHGRLRGGQAGGELALHWRNGAAASESLDLKAEQVELRAVVTWPHAVRVETLAFRFFGGSVRAEETSVDLSTRTLRATLICEQIDLRELAAWFDPGRTKVVSAEGRVEGRLTLTLDRDGRVTVGTGHLRLSPGSTALLRFQPLPGLLTTYLPEIVRKVYPGLAAIELGKTPLHARVMHLELNPPDDPRGRTAVIRIEGRPADPQFVAPLELDINVFGPLEDLLNTAVAARNYLKAGGS